MNPANVPERCNAKSNSTAYSLRKQKPNGENFVLQNSTNFSPAEANDRKKKCFSDQEVPLSLERCDCSKSENSFDLIGLPLVPLSSICTHLSLIDRQMLSQLCYKLTKANDIAWQRRRCLNVKSDLVAYVLRENDDSVLDEYFDFVSLSLIFRKLHLLTPYFVGSRLNTIDFSHPSGSFQIKFGSIFLLNFENFNRDSLVLPSNVFELNFRHTVITWSDLEVCASLFPKVASVVVSLRTVIWPNYFPREFFEASNRHVNRRSELSGDCKSTFSAKPEIDLKIKRFASFLRTIFPRLKQITLHYF